MKKILLSLLAFTITMNLSAQQNEPTDIKTDEMEVKSVVEQFLIVAGNYDLDAMPALFTKNANIGGASFRNEEWKTSTLTLDEFIDLLRSEENPKRYTEPVSDYTIHISKGMLAFVKADATIVREGKAIRNNFDYFTLIKLDGSWKILNGSYVSVPIN